MANDEYKNYEELVEKKYKGKKSINRWKVGALKKAREALRQLNREIDTCYRQGDGEGKEEIGEERLKRIRKCYEECLEAVDNARDKNSQTDILNTIFKVLAEDSMTVNGLLAEDSFPEYFRRKVVAFEAMSVESVGGSLSKRIPMQYEDEKGNQVRGFFTEESRIERGSKEKDKKADMYYGAICAETGENITDRNCAMTEIARLLGREDLLARSTPMEICYQGKKQRGVFMETAKGENIQRVAEQPSTKHLDRIKPSALKDIADLQMIDYICGNVDRHLGNIMYQFDNDGNLAHIQGIDHDLSMGKIKLEGGSKWLPKVENMRVISQTMSEKIKSLQKEDLQTMLAALDLSQEQKNAAWERVEYIKEQLDLAVEMNDNITPKNYAKSKVLFIVPDDKWEKIKAKDLSAEFNLSQHMKTEKNALTTKAFDDAKKYNIFSHLYYTGRQINWNAKNKSNLESSEPSKAVEQQYNTGSLVSLAFRPEVQKKNADIIENLWTRLDHTVGGKLNSRSKEFQDMYQQVKEVKEWYEKNKDKVVTVEEKNTFKELCSTAYTSFTTYIDGHNPYSKIGKERQDIARELMEFIGARRIENNWDNLQQGRQKADDSPRDKAVEALEQIAQAQHLLDGTQNNKAMNLMTAVILADEKGGIPREIIKDQICLESIKKTQGLTSENIREFLEKERELMEKWKLQEQEKQKKNSLPQKKAKLGTERKL